MQIQSDEELRALWQGQPASIVQFTAEQLRGRAAQFERQTRRRYRRDQASFAVAAILFGGAMIAIDGALMRLGSALLLLWAVYGIWGLHRYARALAVPTDASVQTCVAFHRRQLERQRDVVRGWPLGVGLAMPGIVLVAIAGSLGPRHAPWSMTIGVIGIVAFVYLPMLIDGQVLAGRWQQEIDALEANRNTAA